LATQSELDAAQPELERAAASIATLPDILRATRVRLAAQDRRLGLLIWLGCGAVIVFALVLFVLLQAHARSAAAV
jgi:hypothetical protein